jgi:hypothetical protein
VRILHLKKPVLKVGNFIVLPQQIFDLELRFKFVNYGIEGLHARDLSKRCSIPSHGVIAGKTSASRVCAIGRDTASHAA